VSRDGGRKWKTDWYGNFKIRSVWTYMIMMMKEEEEKEKEEEKKKKKEEKKKIETLTDNVQNKMSGSKG